MRLPADGTLIVVGAQEAIDHSCGSAGDSRRVEANLALLIAAWRKEGLPLVHVRFSSAPGGRFEACATPLDGETVIRASAASAFAGSGLEGVLDDAGATTLVVCGALNALEPTARDAGNLGYRVFVPFDACWPPASPADPSAARLSGETSAVVDTAAALSAAATAKARQRREAGRKR
jgi:nicotinamidase-related amidase